MARVQGRGGRDTGRCARDSLLAARSHPGRPAPPGADIVGRGPLAVHARRARRGMRAFPRGMDGARLRTGAAAPHTAQRPPPRRRAPHDDHRPFVRPHPRNGSRPRWIPPCRMASRPLSRTGSCARWTRRSGARLRIVHAEQLASLPEHHSDPFDRMMIAQTRVGGATVVTYDRSFEDYDVPMVWV